MGFRSPVVGALVCAKLLLNTVYIDKYRKFRATYGFDGNEQPVPEKIRKRFREVMNDLKLSEEQENNIQIFSVHDVNIFHAGTLLGYNAIIGIPPNFNYESTDDLSTDQVRLENKRSLWTEETSKKFLESLVLSENAQKFAMAQAILKVKRFEFWFKPLDFILDSAAAILLYDNLKVSLESRIKLKILVYAINVVIAFIIFLIWVKAEHMFDIVTDKEVLAELADLGPKYVQGGIEYYEKLCQREDALRHTDHKVSQIRYWLTRTELLPSVKRNFLKLKLQQMKGEIINPAFMSLNEI